MTVDHDTWHVGAKVPINVYHGDRAVTQCHNKADAAMFVSAMKILDLLQLERGDEGMWLCRIASTQSVGITPEEAVMNTILSIQALHPFDLERVNMNGV